MLKETLWGCWRPTKCAIIENPDGTISVSFRHDDTWGLDVDNVHVFKAVVHSAAKFVWYSKRERGVKTRVPAAGWTAGKLRLMDGDWIIAVQEDDGFLKHFAVDISGTVAERLRGFQPVKIEGSLTVFGRRP